jgi:hypothetical protein
MFRSDGFIALVTRVPGLDPGIDPRVHPFRKKMDCRVIRAFTAVTPNCIDPTGIRSR